MAAAKKALKEAADEILRAGSDVSRSGDILAADSPKAARSIDDAAHEIMKEVTRAARLKPLSIFSLHDGDTQADKMKLYLGLKQISSTAIEGSATAKGAITTTMAVIFDGKKLFELRDGKATPPQPLTRETRNSNVGNTEDVDYARKLEEMQNILENPQDIGKLQNDIASTVLQSGASMGPLQNTGFVLRGGDMIALLAVPLFLAVYGNYTYKNLIAPLASGALRLLKNERSMTLFRGADKTSINRK